MKRFSMLTAALCAVVLLCGFTTTAYAGGGEDYGEQTGGYELWEGVDPVDALPVETIEPTDNAFTPSGTGTVVDNATDEDGKEFFTITTADESVFYLVIDRQRNTENVYFLNAVTVADLLALAEGAGEPIVPVTPTESEAELPVTPEPEPDPVEETEPGGGMGGMILLALAVVLIGGGAAFYFKVYRPKQQRAADAENDYGGEIESYDDEDDGPPWDDDEDDIGEESE